MNLVRRGPIVVRPHSSASLALSPPISLPGVAVVARDPLARRVMEM
jgi:hypothetical protein